MCGKWGKTNKRVEWDFKKVKRQVVQFLEETKFDK